MFDQPVVPGWDGDVRGTSASAVAAGSVDVLNGPGAAVGEVLVRGVSEAGRMVARSAVAARSAPRCAEPELLAGLAGLDSLAARVRRLSLVVLVEAYRRGLHVDTGLSVHDWVALRCPGMSRAQVGEMVTVVKGWDGPGHQVLRDAVSAGQVSVGRAARLLRVLTRVAPVTDAVTYEQAVALLTPVAAEGSERDLRQVTDHLVAVALSDQETEARAKACHDSRGVHESSLAGGSLTRFIVTADAPGAALIRAILASPLAAPAPDATGPDQRSATQRRYDAVLTVLGRGMSSPEGTASTAKAKIFLTIPFTALAVALAGTLISTCRGCRGTHPFDPDADVGAGSAKGATGADPGTGAADLLDWAATATAAGAAEPAGPAAAEAGSGMRWPAPGVGRTFTGEALTPGQVRRLACQADLIPVVLGTHSEVMDLGRESRLASGAQIKKLWLRDRECTFPGCTVPPTWCDAHHVQWWVRGGRTDILNLALLCPRHHSIVHDKDLTATITATGVTWHV